MSNMDLIASAVLTLLQVLVIYCLLPLIGACLAILFIAVAIAVYIVMRNRYK